MCPCACLCLLQLSGRTARGSSGLSGADSFSASLNFVKTAVRALVEAPDDHNSDDEENEDGDDHDGSTSESSESEDSDSDNGDKACGAVQKPASSSDSMVASRPKRCCLVLVLEHFEAFAEEGRQTLLYSLLDLRHEKGLHLIVVAVSTHAHWFYLHRSACCPLLFIFLKKHIIYKPPYFFPPLSLSSFYPAPLDQGDLPPKSA